MTSRPPILYWVPETLAILHAVRSWREEGIQAYFTIDAGPNVHIITTSDCVQAVLSRLEGLGVSDTIVDEPGGGPIFAEEHLF